MHKVSKAYYLKGAAVLNTKQEDVFAIAASYKLGFLIFELTSSTSV